MFQTREHEYRVEAAVRSACKTLGKCTLNQTHPLIKGFDFRCKVRIYADIACQFFGFPCHTEERPVGASDVQDASTGNNIGECFIDSPALEKSICHSHDLTALLDGILMTPNRKLIRMNWKPIA